MIKKINEATPNGGTHSEAFFCDKDWKPQSEANATVVIIREFDKDNNMIFETIMNKEQGN